jgi:hypothetical protein
LNVLHEPGKISTMRHWIGPFQPSGLACIWFNWHQFAHPIERLGSVFDDALFEKDTDPS